MQITLDGITVDEATLTGTFVREGALSQEAVESCTGGWPAPRVPDDVYDWGGSVLWHEMDGSFAALFTCIREIMRNGCIEYAEREMNMCNAPM